MRWRDSGLQEGTEAALRPRRARSGVPLQEPEAEQLAGGLRQGLR